MKYDCKLIQDLLPLYKDGACSEASAQIVKEHLAECPECTKLLAELSDTAIDNMFLAERDNVIENQSRFFKRKSAMIGSIIAGVFALPILICLIVNLASGHALDWFFIVLAAMLIPTSLFVVPLMARENRMFLTMTSFTGSIILLLGVVNIYTHGRWFFLAASAVLFGLTVCFSPFIACRRPVNAYLGNFKGLAVMVADTVTFFLMMLCIGLFVRSKMFFPLAFSISVPMIIMVWAVFLVIKYLPVNGFLKAGIIIAGLSLFSYYGSKAIVFLALKTISKTGVLVYSEPTAFTMIGGLVIGLVFAVIGILKGSKKEN